MCLSGLWDICVSVVLLTHLTLQSRGITLKRGVTAWNLGAVEDSLLGELARVGLGTLNEGQGSDLGVIRPQCVALQGRSMVGYMG